MNPYPQKKIITFNKHTDDFSFVANYADLDYLSTEEVRYVGGQNLSEYKLTGVAEALEKNLGENAESKGIKAHFNLDESGLLNLVNVELVVEKTVDPSEEEGTLSKIGKSFFHTVFKILNFYSLSGSTFSKLFGGKEKPEDGEQPQEEKPVHEIHEDDKPESAKAEEKPAQNKEKSQNGTETKNATEPNQTKLKVVVHKEPIKSSETVLSIGDLSEEQLAASLKKLQELEKVEREINRRATALNNLESFVFDVQNKLEEEEYRVAATEDQIENIRKACSEVSDWLYEDGSEADADTYEKKLDEMHDLTRELFSRVWEHKERPEAVKALHSMLNHSSVFLKTAQNFTETVNADNYVFKDSEVEALDKLINSTTEWRDKSVKEQEETKPFEHPKLTVKMLMDKMASLDREVKYLVNKMRNFRPKKVEKPATEKTTENNQTKPEVDDSETPEVVEVEEEQETIEEPETVELKKNDSKKEEKVEPTSTKKEDEKETHSEL